MDVSREEHYLEYQTTPSRPNMAWPCFAASVNLTSWGEIACSRKGEKRKRGSETKIDKRDKSVWVNSQTALRRSQNNSCHMHSRFFCSAELCHSALGQRITAAFHKPLHQHDHARMDKSISQHEAQPVTPPVRSCNERSRRFGGCAVTRTEGVCCEDLKENDSQIPIRRDCLTPRSTAACRY